MCADAKKNEEALTLFPLTPSPSPFRTVSAAAPSAGPASPRALHKRQDPTHHPPFVSAGATVCNAVLDAVLDAVRDAVRDVVCDSVCVAVRDAVREAVCVSVVRVISRLRLLTTRVRARPQASLSSPPGSSAEPLKDSDELSGKRGGTSACKSAKRGLKKKKKKV